METSLLVQADVPPADPGVPGTVAWLRASVARFSSGDEHARRRRLALDVLAGIPLEGLRDAAATRTGELLPGDLMVIARIVTAGVMGLPNELVGSLTAVARAYQSGDPAADEAVATLVGALSGTPDEMTAARIGVLVQACDATAGLIGNAALSGSTVTATLRDDPPVRATRRLVDGTVRLVELAGVPFGAGPHACPGHEHAIAIASGVLDALFSFGGAPSKRLAIAGAPSKQRRWRVVVDDVVYEDSPTLRIPARLPVVPDVS